MLTEYETTLVLRPNIGGDAIEATLDKMRGVIADGGKLLAIDHWGKIRLAYEIDEHTRGVYIHTHFLGAGQMVAEIERNLRLSEDVLRYLTVRLADGVDPGGREAVEYERPEYDAAAAAEEAWGADGGEGVEAAGTNADGQEAPAKAEAAKDEPAKAEAAKDEPAEAEAAKDESADKAEKE